MTRRETFDKKQQKLERMEKIVRDATRLKDAIKSEVDAIMEEIDAEINSPKKAKPFFWDGKQPHYWNENERVFRKATKHDIRRNVIVCNWYDPNPLHNLENIALLEGITQFDDFTVRSTNGSRLCHFPIAWVECNELDLTFDHVPHICVFMGNALAKVADKPEQVDPLIDEESFLKPEPGTVAEEKWSPRIGDWVRIKKCKSGCWVSGMDYLDGQIRQVEELTPHDHQGIVVDSYWLCENCIDPYPWEPREGEKVQVINVDRVYEVEGFDRITKMVFCVGRSHGIELRLLKPYIEPAVDHIADANKKAPPAGYRLLDKSAKVEPRKAGDLFWSLTLGDWKALSAESEQDANRDEWPACRKIETATPSETPSSSIPDQNEAYRTPRPGDVGKRIEVRDSEDIQSDDARWVERTLVAVIALPIGHTGRNNMGKFVCAYKGGDAKRICHTWRFARIKVEQPAKNPIARYDSEGRNVTELAGLWTEGDTQYREPTYADLANGPIEVEVCGDNTLETNWGKRMLYAVLPCKCMFPFVVGSPGLEQFTQSWKHARIKVEG